MLECPVCRQKLRTVYDNENICTNCHVVYDNNLNKRYIDHNVADNYLDLLLNQYNITNPFDLPTEAVYNDAFILYYYFDSDTTGISDLIKYKLTMVLNRQLIYNKIKLEDLQQLLKNLNNNRKLLNNLFTIFSVLISIGLNLSIFLKYYLLFISLIIIFLFTTKFLFNKKQLKLNKHIDDTLMEETKLLNDTEDITNYIYYLDNLERYKCGAKNVNI